MTISLLVKLRSTEVVEVMSYIWGSAMNSPEFMIVKSGPYDEKSFSIWAAEALINICFMKSAW